MTDLKKLMAEATPGPIRLMDGDPLSVDFHAAVYAPKMTGTTPVTKLAANAALIVAAVNALPELVALRKENDRLREALEKLTDCQPLPKVYKYTGTAEVDVENMFDVGHRHRNGKQPRDYLMSWLSMFRPFAYATKDDSWGELEKLISIVMNNYVQILARAEKFRTTLTKETP